IQRLWGRRGLAWLAGITLTGNAGTALARLRHLLEAVQSEAVVAEAAVVQRAQADPVAQALDAMVGIGFVRGLTLHAEIGDIRRFARGAELASYAGLVPRVEASADRRWTGHITRQGSRWLRWTLVEAAISAMRRPDAVGRWARQLAMRKGAGRARVALA